MATVEQLLKRADGSEVKIVAQDFFGAGLTRSVGVYVLRRESPSHAWSCTSDRPHPDWRTMSVDDYCKYGRSEMLRAATPGEILKVVCALNESYKSSCEARLPAAADCAENDDEADHEAPRG